MRVSALPPEVRHSLWTHSGLTVGSTSLNELTYQGSVEARAPRVGSNRILLAFCLLRSFDVKVNSEN